MSQGKYHIQPSRVAPSMDHLSALSVIVARAGFAGTETAEFPFEPGAEVSLMTAERSVLSPAYRRSGSSLIIKAGQRLGPG